jgi:hypothetical protein
MNDEALVLRLLSHALMEIREYSYEGKNEVAYKLADLIGNVPGQIEHRGESIPDFKYIVDDLLARAKLKGMESWFNNAVTNIHENEERMKARIVHPRK